MKNFLNRDTRLGVRQVGTGSIFIFLSLLSAGLNYAYYPLIARLLTTEEFGTSQVLIALLTQAGALFAGLSLIAIYFSKLLSAKKIADLIGSLQKCIVSLLFFIAIVMGILYEQLAAALHIDSYGAILLVALTIITSVPFIFSFGLFVSQKRFLAAGMLQLSVVVVKLIIGGILAWQFGTVGALMGISLGYVIGMICFWLYTTYHKLPTWDYDIIKSYRFPNTSDLRLLQPYTLPIICILVVATSLVIYPTFDVIIARRTLDAHSSGLYSAASTLSSVVLFAVLPLVNILLSSIKTKDTTAHAKTIGRTSILVLGIGSASVVILTLFPSLLLSFFGNNYVGYSSILWIFGINMLYISLFSLVMQVIALFKPFYAASLSVLCFIILIFASLLYASDARSIIATVAFCYIGMLLISVPVLIYSIRKTIARET